MNEIVFSRNTAIWLSVLTLLSHLWRGFLDAMLVFPYDFGNENAMHLAALIFTLLFAGWAWALFLAWRGSHSGLWAAYVINGAVLLAIPISWLLIYCPAACRADAGIFNLANSINLILGLLTAGLLIKQLQKTNYELSRINRRIDHA